MKKESTGEWGFVADTFAVFRVAGFGMHPKKQRSCPTMGKSRILVSLGPRARIWHASQKIMNLSHYGEFAHFGVRWIARTVTGCILRKRKTVASGGFLT